MANNFLNLDGGSNAKSSTDCLMKLLQLNNLLGSQSVNNGTDTMNGGLGGNNGPGGIFGNSGGGGGGGSAIGGGLTKDHLLQQLFYQQAGVVGTGGSGGVVSQNRMSGGGLGGGVGIDNMGIGSGNNILPKTGRAITNSGNLANNHFSMHQQQQQQQHQQQHNQPDIFSQSTMSGGGVGGIRGGGGVNVSNALKSHKDLSSGGHEFKNTFRSHSTGSDIMAVNHNKPYRNGDGKCPLKCIFMYSLVICTLKLLFV